MRLTTLLLVLLTTWATAVLGQNSIPYGNNPVAGKYHTLKDGTRLYYEVYGKGAPMVLLHGGVYGYIDEFAPFISKLSENYQVICIATRGHGKSENGKEPYTYQQRADDAYQVIRSITPDSVVVLGFSDGAYSGYKLAAIHPELVKKLIAIGAADNPKGSRKEKANYTPESLMSQSGQFFKTRLELMPQPEKWGESLSRLNVLYNEDYISRETFEKIKCPVLVMSGDRDGYHTVEGVVAASRMIPKSQLSIIPGCSHVVFYCNFPAVWEAISPFIK
ncbi:alpha/beta fold hydrolase [Telluribacter humicola]|uniref:alpha/beta fold hydrolase n=1 Tax=Telluribacter humicola TaxID=1720261 RepID=UPI001A959DF9|nr:alpha/beta hydrolase [Telluribacter humicola]